MIANVVFKKRLAKIWASRRGKIALITALLAIVLFAVALVGYFSVAQKVQQILPGGIFEAAKSDPLQTTGGRTNILVFGTSYDDPNPGHTGGYLTDSLIVLSVDKKAKSVYTISIPRDLWVDYDTPCTAGESGKINAVYSCALNSSAAGDMHKAGQSLTDKIGGVLDIQVHYFVQVNYTFIQTLTDALGGIDVDVHTQDERGIYDPNVGLKVPAGTVHMDGKTALKLARARNATGGYGLPQSNFDREINQQRIFAAILKKVSATGQLNDVGTALKLLDAFSGQVQTNVRTSELRSAISAGRSIDMDKVVSIPLTSYVTTGNIKGQSVVLPTAGLNDYAQIQKYITGELGQRDVK